MKTTIDAAGRLVIPKAVRQLAGLTPGMPIKVRYRGRRVSSNPSRWWLRWCDRDGSRSQSRDPAYSARGRGAGFYCGRGPRTDSALCATKPAGQRAATTLLACDGETVVGFYSLYGRFGLSPRPSFRPGPIADQGRAEDLRVTMTEGARRGPHPSRSRRPAPERHDAAGRGAARAFASAVCRHPLEGAERRRWRTGGAPGEGREGGSRALRHSRSTRSSTIVHR